MRAAALSAVLLAAFAASAPAARTGSTSLAITVWPEGRPGPSRTWTLRCDPAGGTLPGAARACRRLDALSDPFRPIPDDAVCTQLYGGPQVAFVRGTYRGRRIWTWFRRRDGCEIARWDRHAFLFQSSR